MKESFIQLLLAEYDRLKGIEKYRFENYERSLQIYLTIVTFAVGAILLILEGKVANLSPTFGTTLILIFVLAFGEVQFLSMLNTDIALTEITKAYTLLRSQFNVPDEITKGTFLQGISQDKNRYKSWSSVTGIIKRALTRSQQKTIVLFINGIISIVLMLLLVQPRATWLALILGLVTFVVFGLLHAVYASWRYKYAAKLLSKGETAFWF